MRGMRRTHTEYGNCEYNYRNEWDIERVFVTSHRWLLGDTSFSANDNYARTFSIRLDTRFLDSPLRKSDDNIARIG